MKIFSNFDTNFKQYTFKKYQDKFGAQNVLLIQKSKLFLFLKIFLPIFFTTITAFIIIYTSYIILGNQGLIYLGLPVSIALIIISLFPIIKNLIDFSMDFAIITPESLIRYNQEGLFNKGITTINSQSIRTITVEKEGLINSIFNNGNIIFLSEGDLMEDSIDYGEIKLHRIRNPESKRNHIAKIINKEILHK
ncbi:MAG: hypothetical protein WC872_01360 [Candidatus Absconditabacterales bacterium]